MKIQNNKLQLTEAEFHQLIKESTLRVLQEGKFSKGLTAAALGGLLYGGVQGCNHEMEMDQTPDAYNPHGNVIQQQRQWIEDHGLDPNDEISWEEASEAVGMDESKKPHVTISEAQIRDAVRNALKNIL